MVGIIRKWIIIRLPDDWISRYVLTVRLLLTAVCLAPLVITPMTEYPMVVGKVIYAHSLIGIAFVLWVPLVVILYPEYRPRRSWVLLAMGAFLVVSLLSALLGPDPNGSLWSTYGRMDGVVNLGHWFAYAVMLASMFRTINHWKYFLMALGVDNGPWYSFWQYRIIMIGRYSGGP